MNSDWAVILTLRLDSGMYARVKDLHQDPYTHTVRQELTPLQTVGSYVKVLPSKDRTLVIATGLIRTYSPVNAVTEYNDYLFRKATDDGRYSHSYFMVLKAESRSWQEYADAERRALLVREDFQYGDPYQDGQITWNPSGFDWSKS